MSIIPENEHKHEPARPLRAGFTAATLQKAAAAKRAHDASLHRHKASGKNLGARIFGFMRAGPGIVLSLCLLGAGTFSAYAVSTNWFFGNVAIQKTHDRSIITVDTATCKGAFYINGLAISGRTKFKVTNNKVGRQQVEQEIRRNFLPYCELTATYNFYKSSYPLQPALASSDALTYADWLTWPSYKIPAGGLPLESFISAWPPLPQPLYTLKPAVVERIDPKHNRIVLAVNELSSDVPIHTGKYVTVTIPLSKSVTTYKLGTPAHISSIKPGDPIVFVAETHSYDLKPRNFTVISIFKTRYDDRQASEFIPDAEPLAAYRYDQMISRQEQMPAPP